MEPAGPMTSLGSRILGGNCLVALRLDSLTAVAAPVAKSRTPIAGLLKKKNWENFSKGFLVAFH